MTPKIKGTEIVVCAGLAAAATWIMPQHNDPVSVWMYAEFGHSFGLFWAVFAALVLVTQARKKLWS